MPSSIRRFWNIKKRRWVGGGQQNEKNLNLLENEQSSLLNNEKYLYKFCEICETKN